MNRIDNSSHLYYSIVLGGLSWVGLACIDYESRLLLCYCFDNESSTAPPKTIVTPIAMTEICRPRISLNTSTPHKPATAMAHCIKG